MIARTSRALFVLGAAAALLSAACSGSSTGPAGGSTVSSGITVGSASINGSVLGPVSMQDSSRFTPVQNVNVRAYLVMSAAGDSVPPTIAGSATSDATGRFSIGRVADGDYTLAVIPPAGSPFGEVGGFVQVRGSGAEVELHLFRLR